MPRTSDKRERLLHAATALIHRHVYDQTTLADISDESGVPLGNVYYYFKTKDQLGAAVIEQHYESLRALLRNCDAPSDPRKRLARFLDKLCGQRDALAKYGCPVGSLCQELNKGSVTLAKKADSILKSQLAWVTKQFRELGKSDAKDLGVQLIATLQGITLLANSMNDCSVIARQTRRLKEWVNTV